MCKSSVESVKHIYFIALLLGICGLFPSLYLELSGWCPWRVFMCVQIVRIVRLVDMVVDQYGLLLVYAWCRLFGGRRTIWLSWVLRFPCFSLNLYFWDLWMSGCLLLTASSFLLFYWFHRLVGFCMYSFGEPFAYILST